MKIDIFSFIHPTFTPKGMKIHAFWSIVIFVMYLYTILTFLKKSFLLYIQVFPQKNGNPWKSVQIFHSDFFHVFVYNFNFSEKMGEYIQLLIQINDFYSSMKKWGNISDFYYRLIIRLFRFINEKMGKYIQLLLQIK